MNLLLLIALIVSALILILVAVLLINAARLGPTPVLNPLPPSTACGDDASVERFRAMLRSATVWTDDRETSRAAFDAFVPKLKQLYPTVFAQLELTLVNTYGIMLRWPGADASRQPVVFMAHHDVVYADPAAWSHDPFAADIADGRIWARGAVDTKCILAGLFEAAQTLLAQGFSPPCDVYICSSDCEETAGDTTPLMIEHLAKRGIQPCLVLDEGGAVVDNAPLVIGREFAVIGVSEKGACNVGITITSSGGHASVPSPNDATAQLVKGLHAMQTTAVPAQLTATVATMLRELAAHGGLGFKLLLGNLWLFRPLVLRVLQSNSEAAAMMHTTYALTELEGSKAPNVLPTQAKANINIRVDPFESVATAVARLKAHFGAQATFDVFDAIEPSPISPYDDAAFDYLRRVIHSVYPNAGITPYVQNGRTDAAYFARICPHTYRFAGFLFKGDQRARVHGADESLDVESFKRGVGFYLELIRNLELLVQGDGAKREA
ncbi:MAG: M20/M25/M40 family metallo-hydrolase [Coriobacteriales bacterium]|jgi:carboxypeptidase PM20D1|nr:M20/M25/M40 family metallo-hydrolase [Coriobacteriales bacterium]